MSGEEVCIVVVPNDFVNDDEPPESSVVRIEERRRSRDSVDKQYDAISTLEQVTSEKSGSGSTIDKRKFSAWSLFSELHTKDYPCPECGLSMASRFRYHVIPKLQLRDTIWIPTNNNKSFFILCYTELGPQSDSILDELRRAEIGIRDGTKVFMIPLSCALGIRRVVNKQKTLSSAKHESVDDDKEETNEAGVNMLGASPWPPLHGSSGRFVKSIRARLTVHKIIGVIRQQSSLTFDYVFFCVLASIIAGLGLLENSTVVLVASMLVSPLMGPIMGFVIGVRIRDRKLWLAGLKSECIGLSLSIFAGFVFGLCTTWTETKWGASDSFPTYEMRIRGDYRRLWAGALVALPSVSVSSSANQSARIGHFAQGAAAGLSILGGNFGSLVGIAISISLLPPAVNSGLLFGYSLLAVARPTVGDHYEVVNRTMKFNSLPTLVNCPKFVDNDYLPLYSCNMAREASQLAVYSFIITLINIACIFLMAMIVLQIKNVVPIIPDNKIAELWQSATEKGNLAASGKVQKENIRELADILETVDVIDRSPEQLDQRAL